MKLIENFIPQRLQDDISLAMSDNNFAWYYERYTVSTDTSRNDFIVTDHNKECSQFKHVFYFNNEITSGYYSSVIPVLYLLEQKENISIKKISRIKANLMLKNPEFPQGFFNTAHIDVNRFDKNYMTLLYYVEDSDGDTVMYDQLADPYLIDQKITIAKTFSPKKGSAILFESNRWHASSPPRFHESRKVINFVFEAKYS